MIKDLRKFTTYEYKDKGNVSFGNSEELKLIGISNIKLTSNFIIKKVLLVKRNEIQFIKCKPIVHYQIQG